MPALRHDVNSSAYPFSATTPPNGAIENRQVGVNATGSYWGGMGEQIDVRSGNLKLQLSAGPGKAQGRGWSVPPSLSYNAQNWRLDQSDPNHPSTWNLNENTAAGFGWNLKFGSLTAYWSNSTTIHHYEFQDSTGATYRMGNNNNGVWSSSHSIYVWYDSTVNILRFRDGSFWLMGCVSYSTEPDAGVMYPTVIENSNGSQVQVAYDSATGVGFTNSSSRITSITDTRGAPAYTLTYSQSAFTGNKIVTSLSNSIQSGESFTFAYNLSQINLRSPLPPNASQGPTSSTRHK